MSDLVNPWTVAHHAPWNFPSMNTGVGCLALLQGIFLTQGSNLTSSVLAGEFFTISATFTLFILEKSLCIFSVGKLLLKELLEVEKTKVSLNIESDLF